MAVNSAGALTVTNSGSGTGDSSNGNDFNTATFDSPIATQTADSSSILDLTFIQQDFIMMHLCCLI